MMQMQDACGKVGYAYVSEQEMRDVYTPQKGLIRGTVFPELDLPMEIYGKEHVQKEVL